MPFPVVIQIGLAVGMLILSYLLTPKPKGPKPPSVDELDEPSAEAGKPIPKVFGSMMLTSPNLLMYADKAIEKRDVPLEK